ncbi:MAG TPA: hypothetical protein PK158_10665 [Spirochaetota bacterium]|nr:hypothetical protein [Spirochaetota bacterium]
MVSKFENEIVNMRKEARRSGIELVHPTKYSDVDPFEWFAENYSLYKLGRTDIVDPTFIDFCKKEGIL